MCLVFILKARGRRGITKAELRRAVDAYASCGSDEAFERMLERDKHDLRDVGVRILTQSRDAYHEDEFAYVLDTGSMLTLPALDADELRVLALAARAWDQGTWDAMAAGALHKLEVFGEQPATTPSPRVTMSTAPHVDVLRAAVRNRSRVRFQYRRPGDAEVSLRTVEPWGLLARAGAWYCIGYDVDRDAARVYRTGRIAGDVEVIGPAQHPSDPNWRAVPEANPGAFARTTARLSVAPGHGWAWRNTGTIVGANEVDGVRHDVLEVSVPDSRRAIGALAAAAPNVVVLEPADLRARVQAHLEEVAGG